MRTSRPKRDLLRIALHDAIQWEESLMDSLAGCKDDSFKAAHDRAKQNRDDFKILQEAMR